MENLLTRPARAWLAVLVAFAIGLGYAIYLFGPAVAVGTSDYWRLPEGVMGGRVDMKVSLSGYYWFVQDAWRWPLFHIARANGSEGANAALFDSIPVLALTGKLIRNLTGAVVDLYPIWITACFALNATALATLVRGLGQRSILAALVAGGIGALAPVVHFRFGHSSLCAHWVFVFVLAAYASWSARKRGTLSTSVIVLLLSLLSCATTLYLYVMTAAIATAFFLQAAADRGMSVSAAAVGLAGVLATGVIPLWSFGLLGSPGLDSVTIPFGKDSMNLMAPFWPQTSGIFGWTGIFWLTRGSIGATNGQYEGYCYLGAGVLFLAAVAVWMRGRAIPGLLRRHWALTLAIVMLTVWAVSNRVWFGPVLVLSYPLPDWLLSTVLAWFRSEGRFFWPVAWLIMALGIAGALSDTRPRMALAVASLALLLQWADLSVWRTRLEALVNQAPASEFGSLADSAALEAEIGRRGRVALAPSRTCNGKADYLTPDGDAAVEVQLMAARTNAEMPAVTESRLTTDCAAERATPLRNLAGNGVLIAFNEPGEQDRTAEARRAFDCRSVPVGWVCVLPAAATR